MNKIMNLRVIGTLLLVTSLSGGLAGCVEESSLNNEDVVYVPEERPLGVLAGSDNEFLPDTTAVLSGRITGTVTDQTLLWQQTSGTPVELSGTTSAEVSFVTPKVNGLEKLTFSLTILNADGSVATDNEGAQLIDEVNVNIFDPELVLRVEAEDEDASDGSFATLSGGLVIAQEGVVLDNDGDHYTPGFSGTGATSNITPGSAVTFTVDVENSGYYSLYLGYSIPSNYGGKVARVTTNGVAADVSLSATSQWESIKVASVLLDSGENTIEVCCQWNYYRVDYIELIPSETPSAPLAVAPELVNENASDEALALMEFFTSNYGSATISGQTEIVTKSADNFPYIEFDKIVEATGGDAPAIVGYDLMNYSSSSASHHDDVTEAMIAAHNEKNVILSVLFHWRAPSGGSDTFYTNETTFDVAAALADTNSAEYAELITDIDIASAELKKLADAGIPVLWRPLHEAQGGWFWWGAKGAEPLKELWKLMYDRMTNHHGLNNLIWVFTHSSDMSEDWYPGDMYVDIIGYDGYGNPVNDDEITFSTQYATLKERHDGQKLIALTETGTIPNVVTMHEQFAWWSFFITWNSEIWNPDSIIGPQGADPAEIKLNYAVDGVLNLDDVPGGREKIEAGIYESFEPTAIDGWGAQVNWSGTDDLTTSNSWSQSALTSLSVTKDMTTLDSPENIILQTYPTDGIDVSNAQTITVYANALNAGAPNVHVFVKYADGESWPDAIDVTEGGVAFSVDVAEVDTLTGLGVRFQNLDATATSAEYLIDMVTLTDADGNESVIYDFEPDTADWGAQVAWSGTPGITTSDEWADSGIRSLALYKDLVAHGAANDIVFQTYPEGGIDVTDKSTLTITANASGVGVGANAHIFFKAPDGVESWPGAVEVTEGGVELTIDVSEVSHLDGFGVRFNGIDASSTDARFFIDNVKVDGSTIYDFEGTGKWEFQVNWGGSPGIQLAKDWSVDSLTSLAGIAQLVEGDDNVILQIYPEGGLLLGAVSMLKVTAIAKDAGEDVQVQLFVKDQDWTWTDSGTVSLVGDEVELAVDVSGLTEIKGFGVRFLGPNNSDTPAQFYIDKVEFE